MIRCLLNVKYFPASSGVVIVVVVVILLILVGCITMDILFCYCCKRKQFIQDNGMYIGVYVCTLCTHIYTVFIRIKAAWAQIQAGANYTPGTAAE